MFSQIIIKNKNKNNDEHRGVNKIIEQHMSNIILHSSEINDTEINKLVENASYIIENYPELNFFICIYSSGIKELADILKKNKINKIKERLYNKLKKKMAIDIMKDKNIDSADFEKDIKSLLDKKVNILIMNPNIIPSQKSYSIGKTVVKKEIKESSCVKLVPYNPTHEKNIEDANMKSQNKHIKATFKV